MTCRVKIVRNENDTYNPLELHLEDEDGFAVDLRTVDHVQLLMQDVEENDEDVFYVDDEMTISDAQNGVVKYFFTTEQADTIGVYNLRVDVWHTALKPESFKAQLKFERF